MNGVELYQMKWKTAKRLVKKGRRFYGAVFQLSDGREIYVARRKANSEIFRGGAANVSTAIEDGTAYWALDDETIWTLRRECVELVAIYVEENADLYIASLADYIDRKKAKVLDYGSRGGALQKYLPLTAFKRIAGATRIK